MIAAEQKARVTYDNILKMCDDPDVAKVILNAAPDRMVYVSCNPASQARDLEILCTDYEITAVRPVDMFPHTHHVENVVALKRKS